MLPTVQREITRNRIERSGLFRDLATGFQQQMFFWGRDAIHAAGNIFSRSGFQKRASHGLQGTSCYSMPWQGGCIELHGAQAGWFGQGGGFLFVRPMRCCVRWLDECAPTPGVWPEESYEARADETMHALAVPFLDWWLAHERVVAGWAGVRYREECYRLYKKLPRSRAWLAPEDAVRWITGLRDCPETLARANRFQ